MRKDLMFHDKEADRRRSGGVQGLCTRSALVPRRAARFDRQIGRHSREVLEQVDDVNGALPRTDRTLRHAGLILFKTRTHIPRASPATITIARVFPRPLPRPVGCAGPRRIKRRLDLTFGPRSGGAILCFEVARTPLRAGAAP